MEKALEAVRRLKERAVVDAAFVAEWRKLVGGRHARAVAKAARLATERELPPEDVEADLVAAFERFAGDNRAEVDKGCAAKAAIAEALQTIRAACAPLYLRGIRLRQLEKTYGGSVDTAVDVRSACAMGLVRMRHPAAMEEIAVLLADPEPGARRAAARTLAYSEDRRAAPLLRFKSLAGDDDASVTAECLGGLVAAWPEASIEFAARFLEEKTRDPAVREMAAVALGESKRAEALAPLRAFYEADARRDDELRATALAAIAMLRQEAAFEYLASLVASAPDREAAAALSALVPYRGDAGLGQRVRAAVAARDADRGASALLAADLARFA